MKNQENPSLDTALTRVDPERRRLLGMLLAGAAALPLLTTTSLAESKKPKDKDAAKQDAGDKTSAPAIKNAWPTQKAGTGIKSDYKESQYKESPYKESPEYKESGAQYKESGTQYKESGAAYKESGAAIKDDARVKTSSQYKESTSKTKSTTAPSKPQ